MSVQRINVLTPNKEQCFAYDMRETDDGLVPIVEDLMHAFLMSLSKKERLGLFPELKTKQFRRMSDGMWILDEVRR